MDIKHGDAKRGQVKRLYRIWANMISRCNNPNKPDYQYYGERGVRVCDEWMDYSVFQIWSINNGYSNDLTLDRINVNQNYCPENCRWATIKTQQNNKRSNHRLEFNGENHTISEWAEILNINRTVIKDRLKAGWSVEETLTTPVKFQNKGITFNKETHSWREWSEITGIQYKTLISRYYDAGWTVKRTLTEPVKRKKKILNEEQSCSGSID